MLGYGPDSRKRYLLLLLGFISPDAPILVHTGDDVRFPTPHDSDYIWIFGWVVHRQISSYFIMGLS